MRKSVKVGYFSPNTPKDIVLTSNGEYILDDICLYIYSTEELGSSNYDMEAGFLVDKAKKYKNIVGEGILKVKEQYGDEIFKICKVTKDMNKIRVYVRQITIDSSLGCWLGDVRPTSLNGQASLEYMLRNTNEYKSNEQYAKDLEVFSDITKSNTAYYQDITLYQAIHDSDQSFKNRWGGEVQRRGYRISINNRIGTNRGFQVRSSKNLLGFEAETNVDSVVTRIKPKGFDGITIDGYVDSPLINNYSRIYTREIKYEDIKVKGGNDDEGYDTLAEAQTELIKRATAEFTENHIDEIQATYTISFLDLSKTEEYKDYAILERCYIGDTVNVYEEKLGININVRVNKIKYDILAQEVVEIELTNSDLSKYKVPSIFDIKNQLDKIPSSDSILIEAKKNATDLINAGLKDSYVITRKNELLIMDTQDINTAKNVWRWNNGGLGFSSTGYYGEFGTAITRDGKIVADFITTGVLNANLIKTGVLSSFNGKSSINMGNGTFNFGNKLMYDGDTVSLDGTFETHNSNGSNAIKIEKVKMHFYEWNTSGRSVGTIYSGEDTSNSAIKSMNMSNSMTSYLMLGYEISNGTKNSYIVFDKYNKVGKYNVPINITEKSEFSSDAYFPNQVILGSAKNTNNPSIFRGGSGNVLVLDIDTSNSDNGFQIQSKSGGVPVSIKGGRSYPINLSQNTQVLGSFSVSGSKNSIQATKNYGERLINAYETAEYYFADIGSGVVNTDGECLIYIDEILQECINTKAEYHVFTQVYNGSVDRIERFENYFIVYGKAGTSFGWEIKAKRKGYENVRLDSPEIGSIEDIPIFTEEDLKPKTGEDILIQELEFNLEEVLMEVV
ncbi:phage tail spike protein [Clostridium sp.]|uniref:phage tail spike protein n=1 Tax=Clostridium sp. TaxID=1506 RepID=UPI001D3183B8|nr:phage tail spike protein [Clostridium sp.]MBS5937766.1 phage tail protein [Clostridium sp.]